MEVTPWNGGCWGCWGIIQWLTYFLSHWLSGRIPLLKVHLENLLIFLCHLCLNSTVFARKILAVREEIMSGIRQWAVGSDVGSDEVVLIQIVGNIFSDLQAKALSTSILRVSCSDYQYRYFTPLEGVIWATGWEGSGCSGGLSPSSCELSGFGSVIPGNKTSEVLNAGPLLNSITTYHNYI